MARRRFRPAGTFTRARRAAKARGGTATISATGVITVRVPTGVTPGGQVIFTEQKFARGQALPDVEKLQAQLIAKQKVKALKIEPIKLTKEQQARVGAVTGLRGKALEEFVRKASPAERRELLRGLPPTVAISRRGKVVVGRKTPTPLLFEEKPPLPTPTVVEKPPTFLEALKETVTPPPGEPLFKPPRIKERLKEIKVEVKEIIKKPSKIFEPFKPTIKEAEIAFFIPEIKAGIKKQISAPSPLKKKIEPIITKERAERERKAAERFLIALPSKTKAFVKEKAIPTTKRLAKQFEVGFVEAVKQPKEFAQFTATTAGAIALGFGRGIKKEPGKFVKEQLVLGLLPTKKAELTLRGTKVARALIEEPAFARQLPEALKEPTRVVLKAGRLAEGVKPPLRRIRFKEIKTLTPTEAKAVRQTLQELGTGKSIVFGSAAGRAAGLKTVPKDIDIAVKSKKLFKETLAKKSRKLGIVPPTKKLDIKEFERLRPQQDILGLGPGFLPTPEAVRIGPKVLRVEPLFIPTKPAKVVEGIKITAFGEQLQRKGLGTLQVLLEKEVRRAKDPAAFVESLKLAITTIERKKPISPLGILAQKRRVRELRGAVQFLESKETQKLLRARVPKVAEFPIKPTARLPGVRPFAPAITVPRRERPSRIPAIKPTKLPEITRPSRVPKITKPSRLPSTLPSQLKGSKLGRSTFGISRVPTTRIPPTRIPTKPSVVPSILKPSKVPPSEITPSKIKPSVLRPSKIPASLLPSLLPSQLGISKIPTRITRFPPPTKKRRIRLGPKKVLEIEKKKKKRTGRDLLFKPSLAAIFGKVIERDPLKVKRLLTGKIDPIGIRPLTTSDPISRRVLGLDKPTRGGIF